MTTKDAVVELWFHILEMTHVFTFSHMEHIIPIINFISYPSQIVSNDNYNKVSQIMEVFRKHGTFFPSYNPVQRRYMGPSLMGFVVSCCFVHLDLAL